ncbi:MAG: hypothetical protein ACJ8KA_09545 [Sulfurifustis sp.]
MRSVLIVSLLATVLALTACASNKPVELVQMPHRDADVYPWAQKRDGVSVTVDEIADPARVKQYFGVDLLEAGLLPVDVIASNHGQHRVTLKPSDVLLLDGRRIIDPLPIERVTSIVKAHMSRVRAESGRKVEAYFRSLALRETTLAPNDSYHGVLFFPAPQTSKRDRFFSAINLFIEGGTKMRVALTDLDTQARMQFGPFSLSDAPRWRESSYASRWKTY